MAQLLAEIQILNAKIPADQAQALTRPTEILREASTSLDKGDLSYGLKKIKDTAITLGEIAKPVLDIVVRLLAL